MLTLAVWTAPGSAGVKPGEMITADTAAKVKDAVSPGIFIRVQGGMQLKIVPTQRVDWPPPYKDATEKYSAQVRLSRDHRTAVGYVAISTGIPCDRASGDMDGPGMSTAIS